MEPSESTDPAVSTEGSGAVPSQALSGSTLSKETNWIEGFPTSSGAVIRKVVPRPNVVTMRSVLPTEGIDPNASTVSFTVVAGHNELIR